MTVNFDAIPAEMKSCHQWLLWKFEERDGKKTKVPYRVNGHNKASSTNPKTWCTFDAAKKAQEFRVGDGIGFVFTRGSFSGIDVDHCRNKTTGIIDEWALPILKTLNSYTEISPSGEGVHIIVVGSIPEGRTGGKERMEGPNIHPQAAIEIYSEGRFFTVTGNRLEGYSDTPENRQDELRGMYLALFDDVEDRRGKKADPTLETADKALILKAMCSKNGDLFKALWDGSTLGYGHDDSAADMALCNYLAFWTRKNSHQMDRLFRRSKLMRPKWDEKRGRQTYGEITIAEAIRSAVDVYEPPKENTGSPVEEIAEGGCDIQKLIKVYKKWLYIKEDYSIVGPMVAAIANFCLGDPDIIGVIAPSGSTKTEAIRALGTKENQFIYPISSLSEHTFISGYVDKKGNAGRDLIPELKGRLMVIKDLTTILAKREDVRSQIFADFRELTDGYIKKEFGNGVVKEYVDIHTSILFACTNAIERYYSMYSNLGQRMIFLRPYGDKIKAREKSISNSESLNGMREEIHKVTMQFLTAYIDKIKLGLPGTPQAILDEMGPLYDFLALARTTIHHDFKGNIDEIPEPEYPTRIANTLTRLMKVHALIFERKEVGAEDVAFGVRIIRDNVPTTRLKLLLAMAEAKGVWLTSAMIAEHVELPTPTVKHVLDELFALHLVAKLSYQSKTEEDEDRRSDSYMVRDTVFDSILKLKIDGCDSL